MSKSICIKTNNQNDIDYLIHELEVLELDNVYFSCKKFKNYKNIIIHYKGESTNHFYSKLSKLLSYIVLDLHEISILRHLISSEYFYFSNSEQEAILDICINSINCEKLENRFHFLESAFYDYINSLNVLNLFGFINFRLYKYVKYLDSIIDVCVNKFIIDQEYLEFVNTLKSYVNTSIKSSSTVHLIYKNKDSILLDSDNNIISYNSNIFNAHFLSDISFSSNDYALNNLLTLLPSHLYVHLIDDEDEFINTLKLVFSSCIHICKGCNICNLYKNSEFHNNIH